VVLENIQARVLSKASVSLAKQESIRLQILPSRNQHVLHVGPVGMQVQQHRHAQLVLQARSIKTVIRRRPVLLARLAIILKRPRQRASIVPEEKLTKTVILQHHVQLAKQASTLQTLALHATL
jgi:hypothetical protein